MAISPLKNGRFRVQIDRRGIPRVRKLFKSRQEAELFERDYLAQHRSARSQISDQRTLLDLVRLWFRYHGSNLSDSQRRNNVLEAMAVELGNPIACTLTPEPFMEYRFQKLRGVNPISEKTFNNHQGYLNSVYNKLRKLKIIDYENPIGDVDMVRIQERQLSYLSADQIATLFEELKNRQNRSVWWIAQICIRTGARWGEAERLKRKQIYNNRITYEFTKSKKTRTVPVDPEFYADLVRFCGYMAPEDRVFTNAIGAFRRAVAKLGINLPRGQMTHILRHTFASHFMMCGCNILVLQEILGHADIKMTMRYAHLAPHHLSDAIKFNPLAESPSMTL